MTRRNVTAPVCPFGFSATTGRLSPGVTVLAVEERPRVSNPFKGTSVVGHDLPADAVRRLAADEGLPRFHDLARSWSPSCVTGATVDLDSEDGTRPGSARVDDVRMGLGLIEVLGVGFRPKTSGRRFA
jgi:hypothetical protein